uniref:Major sperm protein n=1 Tax=Rhabditophanes sp. KR3021 TaxID=114890 RepID=A0AC35U0W2_9BILA
MAKQQILQLEPDTELTFTGPFTDVSTTHLVLVNPSDKYVAFKVKTTAPKFYCVRPNSGIIAPDSKKEVAVMLQPMENTSNIESERSKHKFMIQSAFCSEKEQLDDFWKSLPTAEIMDSKLKVQFAKAENSDIANRVTQKNTTTAPSTQHTSASSESRVSNSNFQDDETTQATDKLESMVKLLQHQNNILSEKLKKELVLLALAVTSHLKSVFTNPGAVPLGNKTNDYIEFLLEDDPDKKIYECVKCLSVKPDRAAHCRTNLVMDEVDAKYSNILHIPPKPIIKLIEKVNKIFVLSLAIAIGYAAFCVMPENSIGTYISEKALMAGLVNEGFNPTIYGYKNRDQITEQLRSQSNNNNRSSLISRLLEDMGYRGYLQNFNYTKEGRNNKNQNVYSIIKCQRGPGTESIIVVIPMTAKYIDSQVLALELFNFLNSMQNWSKNVIFLFTPNLMGTQAFLSSFYNQAHSKIQYDSLQFSSGDLIGGVVLNLVGKKFGKLNIQYNMINGRYPNLDWFNGVLRIGEKFDLSTMIHTPTLKNVIPTNTGELMYHGETCSRSVVAQAFSETENFHSLFGLHCVSVVTLQSDFKVNGHVSTRSMTRLVEATVRALNNLDERFHHSYQFYLLTGPRNFLSIAFYEPIIGIFCVPILIKALQEYYSTITVASVSSLTKVVGVPSCSKELTPVFTLQHTNITGVLTRSLPTPLLLDCSEHCASSSDCIGVEYWQAQGICRVIGASKTETYDITDETSVLLTKSCVKSDRICSSPFHFDVHEQKILIGFAREVVPAESVENCMSACLNAFDTFGFECESAMFYPVDSECILNTEDRLDRADLFVDEKEDTVLYLDSNCAGSQCYAPYITQYIAVEGKQIENELDRKFDNIDFQSCEELCTGKVTVTSNEFTCKSFMYNSEDNVCYLSDERSKPLGRATLVNATGFTYYEKKCFASPRTCRATASFQRVPQKILVGFAAFVMENVPSVTMCLDQCTNPPPETSSDKDKPFECRSVMYYYNEMECILNAETRLSKPDLFIPEGDDFVVDYFDISCHLDAETCPQGTSLRGIKSINAALPEGDGSLHVIESAGTGVAECMSKCLALAPEKCRSFNFEKKTGLCNLLYLDGKTTLRPYVKSGFDLIDLQCLSTQPDCSPGKSGVIYTKYLYSQQSGLATKTEKVVAISACLNKCSEAEKCSGVNYNRRSGECSYFESVDDVSELKKSDHVDFYINLCLVKENSAAISSAINVPQIIVSNKTASVSTKEEKLLNLTGKVQKPHLREQEQARRKGVNGENSVAEGASTDEEKKTEEATTKTVESKISTKEEKLLNLTGKVQKPHLREQEQARRKGVNGENSVAEGASTDEEKKTEEATTKTVESKSEGKTIDGSAPVVEVTTTGTKSGPAPTPILISADRVQTVCDYDGIKVQIKSPQSFTGVIFVKNHYESCRVEVTGADSATLELGLPASFGMKPIAISSSNATVGDSATISTRKRRETPAVKSCGITETENGKYKSTVVVQTNNLGIAG